MTKNIKVKDSAKKTMNKKKSAIQSDSESDSEYETYSEFESDSDSDSDSNYIPPKSKKNKISKKKKDVIDDEMQEKDFKKIRDVIHKMFPTKYMDKKMKNKNSNNSKKKNSVSKYNTRHKGKKRKQEISSDEDEDEEEYYEDEEEDEEEEEEEEDEDSEEEDEISDEDEDEEDEDEEDEDEEEEEFVNILLLDGGEVEEDEYIEDNAECDSDDEKMFMKEKYEENNKDSKESSDEEKKMKKKKKKPEEDEEADIEITDVEQEYLDLVETKKTLSLQLIKRPNSKVLKKAVKDCNKSIKRLVRKARNKNAKIYHKLIHKDKKKANEVDYFKKKLSNKEQLRVMKELKEINKHINIDKPYRLALLDTIIPAKFKAVAMQRLNVLRTMEPGDPEYYKIRNWVDTFMRIPFGVYRTLSINMNDGVEVCNNFMENAKNTLDICTYGLEDAKLQIMQMMGQWISNPSAMGTAIAIKGPMGTGKTTLVKEGISKILGREFSFIALGGNGDSSFLEGHSYTYEGSTWGKIVQILIDSKCMNPIIYFDELDKVSDTPKGEEIIGILTHLTDTSQNSEFHDKYFSEVSFDLSKCLFIFSYNDESKVNPILRDRMYRIQTKGYECKEKIIIARNHLLPKIREQVNFTEKDVIIPDETISYIVSNKKMTDDEQGVRNLKRCLEIIHTKLNLFRLVKDDSNMFKNDMKLEVTFPFTVNKEHVDILIKNNDESNQSFLAMYI
tara:strand:+ start:19781 stop:21964 length:2184 start_codon:yes stop_codon:yes gene_type:complete